MVVVLRCWEAAGRSVPYRNCLLSEPLGVALVLAVHVHLLRPQRHAAVAVEVEAVVAADVSPLLLRLTLLRLQELRQAGFSALGPVDTVMG